MHTIDADLEAIGNLVTVPTTRAEAEERLRSLVVTLGSEELRVYEPELRRLMGSGPRSAGKCL